MTKAADPLRELRLDDVLTFLEVRRRGALSAAASALGVTPSQVSKAIARLERLSGGELFVRDRKRLRVGPEGEAFARLWERLLGDLRGGLEARPAPRSVLTVAGASYLVALFAPELARAGVRPRVRGLEMGVPAIRANLYEGAFDVALVPEPVERLPAGWASVELGTIRQGLFATPAIAAELGDRPLDSDDVRHVPFVVPFTFRDGQHLLTDDGFPLPMRHRTVSHEVMTFGAALEMASRSPGVAFGPAITAAPYVASGRLVEIVVRDLPPAPGIALVHHEERITFPELRKIADVARGLLDDHGLVRAAGGGVSDLGVTGGGAEPEPAPPSQVRGLDARGALAPRAGRVGAG